MVTISMTLIATLYKTQFFQEIGKGGQSEYNIYIVFEQLARIQEFSSGGRGFQISENFDK